jgi:hypothetical protein
MALLNKKQIIEAHDLRTETVPIPEWGGEVIVRGLTGAAQSRVEATMVAAKGQAVEVRVEAFKELRQRIVAEAIVDENGKRMFSDAEIKQLGEKSASALQRVFDKAQELSGMDSGSLERAEGN